MHGNFQIVMCLINRFFKKIAYQKQKLNESRKINKNNIKILKQNQNILIPSLFNLSFKSIPIHTAHVFAS